MMENTSPGTMPISQGGGPYGYPKTGIKLAPASVIDAPAIAWGYEPSTKYTRDLLWQGILPLWNNRSGLGNPLLADGMSNPLEPLMVLSYLVPSQAWPWSVDLLVLARFFLGGWFTYLFARRIGSSFWPGLFAGIAYMLSYQIVVFGNSPQLAPQILTPLLLLAFDHLALKPSLKSLTGTALVIVWIICSGLPEASFLALMMAGLWFVYRSAWRMKEVGFKLSVLWRWFIWGAAAILSGVALSAWYWIPLVENISISTTTHSVGRGLAMFNPLALLLGLLPPMDTFTGFPNFRVVVLTLAIAAVFIIHRMGKKIVPVAFFLGYTLIFGLGIYGVPPFMWIGYLPGYSQTTLPHYLVSTLVFSLILLGTLGLDTLIQTGKKIIPIALACMIQAGVLGYFFGLNQLTFNYSHRRIGVNLLIACGIMLAMGGISFLVMYIKKPQWMAGLVIILSLSEILVVHRNLLHPVRYNPYTVPPFVTYLSSIKEPFRVTGFDGTLMPNTAMAYGIDDLRYLAAIEPNRRLLFMVTLVTPNKAPDRLAGWESPFLMGRNLNLLNIRYILSPTDIAIDGGTTLGKKYELVYDAEIKIYENPDALPRAFILFATRQAADANQAVNILAEPSFDPYSTAVIEKDFWNSQLQALNKTPTKKWQAVPISHRDANSLTVQTESAEPGVLVVSETYYPGWKATIDGQSTQVFPTDDLLRGIYLPAGSHRVDFFFQPMSFMIGSGITLGAGLILLAIWGFFLSKGLKARRFQSS